MSLPFFRTFIVKLQLYKLRCKAEKKKITLTWPRVLHAPKAILSPLDLINIFTYSSL